MLVLQSHDLLFVDVILLESETAAPVRRKRRSQDDYPLAEIAGNFAEVEGTLFLFFAAKQRLYLRAGSQLIEITPEVVSEHSESGGVSRLTLREGDRTLFTFSYETPDLTGTLAGIVAFVDEEDYDYPLHVHRVLANPDRRGQVWLDRS
jgi:hypothetical protein